MSSSNDVVERPLLERPVGHIHHAIPLREAPLRDDVPFYAPVEHPSSQHRLPSEKAPRFLACKVSLKRDTCSGKARKTLLVSFKRDTCSTQVHTG